MGKVNSIANIGLYSLSDGGFGDEKGIAAAIVAGASEIFILENGSAWKKHFRNFPGRSSPHEPVMHLPIFKEEYDWADGQIDSFAKLVIPENINLVSQVLFGTVEATTVESED